MKNTVLVLSCEHAVNHVPKDYVDLFKGHQLILNSHRGLDIGAEAIANHLSQSFQCGYNKATISRLLIDCNRSLNNKRCFTEFSQPLSREDKQELIDTYYLPYRYRTEQEIDKQIAAGLQVLHLSIHTFIPVLNGQVRTADIGILYDPARHGEKEVARIWHGLLINQSENSFRIRKNYPYSGKSDGFTRSLRQRQREENYLGIELEVNQALIKDTKPFNQLLETLTDSLSELLQLL